MRRRWLVLSIARAWSPSACGGRQIASNEQLPIHINNAADKTGCEAPFFPFDYGLEYGDPSPEIKPCEGP